MGFLLLELAIVVVLTCLFAFEHVHSTPPAAGGRRAKAVQGKQVAVKSEAASVITSGNLEEHYASFFFAPMEDNALKLNTEIDAFLMKKWAKNQQQQLPPAVAIEKYGKGLAGKGGSSMASSSSSGDVKAKKPVMTPVVTQTEEANAELLARLHLAELKAILVPKREKELDKSPLAKKFRRASADEHVLKAKARMRGLVGSKSMFLELEMRQPLLLRLDLAEPDAALAYYKEALLAPWDNLRILDSHIRVRIPILFYCIFESEKMLRGSRANVVAEVSCFWKAAMLPQLEEHGIINNDNEGKLLDQLASTLEDGSFSLLRELIQQREQGHGNRGINYLQLWTKEARKRMAFDLFEHDPRHQLRQYIQLTPGARTRFYRFFPESEAFEKYLVYAWPEADYMRRLRFEYIRFLTVADPGGHLKSKMTADILVQVLRLEKQFAAFDWIGLRDRFLLIVDQMVVEDVDFANNFGSLVKHMLYKLRNQQHPNHGDQWNFASLFDAEIKKWKEFVENGPSEFLVSPEESAAQADWLKREHAAMLDRLSLSNEELDIAASPQVQDRMKELVGSEYVTEMQNLHLQEQSNNVNDAIHSQQQPQKEMISAKKPAEKPAEEEIPKGKEEATAEEEQEAGSSDAGSQM